MQVSCLVETKESTAPNKLPQNLTRQKLHGLAEVINVNGFATLSPGLHASVHHVVNAARVKPAAQ